MTLFPNTTHYAARRGLTMIELVVCMAITSMLIVGLSATVRLATVSFEDATVAGIVTLDASEAADRVNADLRMATTFSERTATAVTFKVPDQTGDGADDTIRYAWAGAGNPLTRALNGGTATNVLDNINSLGWSFLTRTVQPAMYESGETLLASYSSASPSSVAISKNNYVAQLIAPSLPSGTLCWRITRIRLQLAQGASSNTLNVSVRYADSANKPSGFIMETYSVNTSTFPTTAALVDFPFSTLYGLDPARAIMVQLDTTTNASIANASVNTLVVPVSLTQFYTTSSNQGSSWTVPLGTSSVLFELYGTTTIAQ